MEMGNEKKSLKNSRGGTLDFLLNVVANEEGEIIGEAKYCESCETKYFKSLIEMILLINGKLNQMKFSQPTNQIRSWNIHKVPILLKGGKCHD